MNYGFVVTKGDPRTAADLAREAEEAGWDGVFYWDGINVGEMETYDPWVVMAAMAVTTERVRLGAIVTPPARRRPWKLARETMTLDHLSGGRLVLPVGLGAADDGGFSKVGAAGLHDARRSHPGGRSRHKSVRGREPPAGFAFRHRRGW